LARPQVRGTFSAPRPRRPAAPARLARTLGITNRHFRSSGDPSSRVLSSPCPRSGALDPPCQNQRKRPRACPAQTWTLRLNAACGATRTAAVHRDEKPTSSGWFGTNNNAKYSSASKPRAGASLGQKMHESSVHPHRGPWGLPASSSAPKLATPNQAQPSKGRTEAVLPNPSLKWSANGTPPGPGCGHAVHCPHPGPGAAPLSPS
jgi:hypothetical protein